MCPDHRRVPRGFLPQTGQKRAPSPLNLLRLGLTPTSDSNPSLSLNLGRWPDCQPQNTKPVATYATSTFNPTNVAFGRKFLQQLTVFTSGLLSSCCSIRLSAPCFVRNISCLLFQFFFLIWTDYIHQLNPYPRRKKSICQKLGSSTARNNIASAFWHWRVWFLSGNVYLSLLSFFFLLRAGRNFARAGTQSNNKMASGLTSFRNRYTCVASVSLFSSDAGR